MKDTAGHKIEELKKVFQYQGFFFTDNHLAPLNSSKIPKDLFRSLARDTITQSTFILLKMNTAFLVSVMETLV